jgi:hypothetical protein
VARPQEDPVAVLLSRDGVVELVGAERARPPYLQRRTR